MTSKELILTYLQEHGGSRSVDIHAHLADHGLKRESSMSALSKLVRAGEVIRARFRQDYICWLKNTNVVISPSEMRNRLSNANRRLNALCSRFITEQQNSLETDWLQYFGHTGFVWCNPPYSDITPWVKKASEECAYGIGTVMLVPADTSVGWFKAAQQACTEVRFITGGRLSFIRADTGKPVNGNNKGSMLIIWNPFCPAAGNTGYVDRDTLLRIGETFPCKQECAA